MFRNLSLGRKLYAGFGLVLALLVAVAGIALFEIGSLSSAHGRVSDSVVPKLLAAGAVAKSGSDMHFSQTRYVLDHGATRADYEKDVSVYSSDLAALQKLSTTAADRTSLAAVLSANDKRRTAPPRTSPRSPASAAGCVRAPCAPRKGPTRER